MMLNLMLNLNVKLEFVPSIACSLLKYRATNKRTKEPHSIFKSTSFHWWMGGKRWADPRLHLSDLLPRPGVVNQRGRIGCSRVEHWCKYSEWDPHDSVENVLNFYVADVQHTWREWGVFCNYHDNDNNMVIVLSSQEKEVLLIREYGRNVIVCK